MAKAKKFGALSGVFTPSILTILGVIMYLRLPWIVGQAGLWATVGIILVAHIISFTTALSVSSIATDKKVETGGSYYIISRTLGLPIGGTLGIALFIGLSFSVSLYLIGFAEVFLGFAGFEPTLNNIRIAGGITLLLLTLLTFISTSLAIKSQFIILTALALSLVSVFFGNHDLSPQQPLFSSMSGSLPWITLFAIFFPAVTGFEAGVSMSGDLKDPRKHIPGGTIAAVLAGLAVYLGLAFFFSYTVDRNSLVNDSSVLFAISWIPELVVAGILGATLSSALGSILGAPRILQATAIDKITPAPLAKGFGASREPRNALMLTFIIALSGILIGELNMIARIVTIFFIITYGFLNITYAIESWAGTDFRPSFRIPGVIAVIGAVTCIVVMIQLDVVAMIGASLLLVGLFLFLKRRELTLQTGDTWNSVWASVVKTGLGKLTSTNREPRNWRPNIILFSGGAKHRPHLIEMAKALVGKLGIFTNFELVENRDEKTLFSKSQQVIEDEAISRKGVFTRRHVSRDVYEGMESIAKIYGFSGFEPNTVFMGWPRNTKNPQAFSALSTKLKRLDYNQVYLHYDKAFGYGKKKKIDIWWSGSGRNLSLAISLLRFITSSSHWRTAKVRILAVSNHSNLTEKYYELLDQVLENKRINADIKIINNSVEKLSMGEILRSESIETDLAIVEMDQRQEDFFKATCNLTDNLPTSLILSASTFFDDHSIVERTEDDKLETPEDVEKPGFQVAQMISLPGREIIAGEVYNLALQMERITRNYYENGFDSIGESALDFQNNLKAFVEKTTDHIYTISKNNDQATAKAEFLKALNDISFRAQGLLKILKQEVLTRQSQNLQNANIKYIAETEKYLKALPEFIRVKYNWKEYRKLKADSFKTSLFKSWKLLKARVTGRPAIYKINVRRAARYYLYHKRLEMNLQLLHEFAMQSFKDLINTRNILSGIIELAEKGKSHHNDITKIRNIVQMEKDRFMAALSVQADSIRNFYNGAGKTLEEGLMNDLQDLNYLLDRPGANFLSKPFEKTLKQDLLTAEQIQSFSATWHSNATLFVNKIYLDFLLQALKNRTESKIRKYNIDFRTQLAPAILNPISNLNSLLTEFMEKGKFSKKPERSDFKIPSIEKHYNQLFDEINSLFTELPMILSIAGDDLSSSLEEKKFEEAHEVVISVKKTVEFSVASELIDQAKKQILEISVMLGKSHSRILDYVRLINFNFYDQADSQEEADRQPELINDFLRKLEEEKKLIEKIMSDLESGFEKTLKNTFAPLSSSVIAKTSGSISRQITQSRNQRIYSQLISYKDNLKQSVQQQFVRLIYSRSESILWMGKMENPRQQNELTNEEVYSWLDIYSPKPELVNQLPFYYGKLFSGQSGIGDDFWVGMNEEVASLEKAIDRFKVGQPGCILVTGERNSGKSSLCRYVVRKNFAPEKIHNLRAPLESTCDPQVFEDKMLKTLGSVRSDLETAFNELASPVVFIINDLELWWERRDGGTAVIERLLYLIKKVHRKALFIINVNIYSLKIINKLTGINSWAMGIVACTGFDAKELRDLIMTRHQAGSMQFVMNKKDQESMTAWGFARLFNRFFDLSNGNPGLAINLWIASIKRVAGNTIYMEKPPLQSADFLDKLTGEQLFYLLQFVYHLRLSTKKLAEIINSDEEVLHNHILNLWQSGILAEKFPGVYAINPALHHALVYKMKTMKLL